MKTEILFENKEVLVVHKPAGIAVQTAQLGRPDVVSELKNYLAAGKPPYLGVIHRLDQPVEGVLVFAKTPKSAAALTAQLKMVISVRNIWRWYVDNLPKRKAPLWIIL